MGFVLLSMILPSSGTQLPGDVDAMYDGWSGHTLPKPSAGFGLEGNGTGITVHIVPHSHEDLGWLKTVDECFYGSNNSIQHAAVQYILDTVVAGLRDHPDRRFTQAEQGFFQRWWHMQDNATQAMVRQLIDNGQLSFVGGGWSQHDEACPHYVTMIDQMTMGHKFLADEFGFRVKVGWQIDPFGHSSTNAALSALMGMDAQYYARIDYQDRVRRRANRAMEVVWRPSPSLGADADLLSGAFVAGSYCNLPNFQFSQGDDSKGYGGDQQVKDNPNLEGYNVKEIVDGFVGVAEQYANWTRGSNVLFLMGCDYQWEHALEWYGNLDKLIHHVNKDGRVRVLYSTPEVYTEHKKAEDAVRWPTKTDDFMTIAQDWSEESGLRGHMYWAGYYTSRPLLKRFAREQSSHLQAAKQLQAIARLPLRKHLSSFPELMSYKHWPSSTDLTPLKAAVGLLTHHDAVTGTPKQHVAYDYARHLDTGRRLGDVVVTDALSTMTGARGLEFLDCPLSGNQTLCPPLRNLSRFAILVYNPQSRHRLVTIRVPWSRGDKPLVTAAGAEVPSAVVPRPPTTPGQLSALLPEGSGALSDDGQLVFQADLGALSAGVYEVTKPDQAVPAKAPVPVARGTQAVSIENEAFQVAFEAETGLLSRVTAKGTNQSTRVSQKFLFYEAAMSGDGPWMLRVNHSDRSGRNITCIGTCRAAVSVVKTGLVEEVHQTFAPWLTQVVRLVRGGGDIEFEWTVGPVPLDDGKGKEIISRFSSSIDSGDTYYTDSNAYEVLRRRRYSRPTYDINLTEPVTVNFFPINSALVVKDAHTAMSITPDRTQAGASLASGEAELIVHRRLIGSDYPGFEPLNETQSAVYNAQGFPTQRLGPGIVVRGTHRLWLGSPGKVAAAHRDAARDVFYPPLVRVARTSAPIVSAPAPPTLAHDLPPNVDLVSFESLGDGQVLLRLGHRFAVGEDAILSRPVNVSLGTLFDARTLVLNNVTEMALSLAAPKAAIHKFHWPTEGPPRAAATVDHTPQPPLFPVLLRPMAIRSFIASVTWTKQSDVESVPASPTVRDGLARKRLP